MGARIEIIWMNQPCGCTWSLPSWERGLKSHCLWLSRVPFRVAPLVGARIEIFKSFGITREIVVAPLVGARIEIVFGAAYRYRLTVAPLVGARIEMFVPPVSRFKPLSLPSWERGLKSHLPILRRIADVGRSPRGSAD